MNEQSCRTRYPIPLAFAAIAVACHGLGTLVQVKGRKLS